MTALEAFRLGLESQRIVVVGAAGFGREILNVLDALRAAGRQLDVLGVIDDAPSPINLERLDNRGVRYLGTIEQFGTQGLRGIDYLLGIGNPAIRARVVARIEAAGAMPFTANHPSATIGARTSLADGVVICAGVAVSTNVQLGRHVHLNPNATIGHDADLRDYVSVNPAAVISGEVTIGRSTLVGAGAIVLQGLTVGEGVVIGAGAVVTKDVPDGVVVTGIPGRWKSGE